ncbi:MAG: DUF3493 domain-containing protein [Cyanobacteria bacterium QS_8_64_29]|jgi:hypothetical protein|nr:MAG: DUF3493 domain-containing protein [Cyanobacteria bacterium QS_8_64_29]
MPESQRHRNALDPTQRERLKAEAKAPYRGLRKVIYGVVGASGSIGAAIFLTQLLAGRGSDSILADLALQLGAIGAAVGLFQLERRLERKR